jgi:hypothetical protein
MEAAKDLKLVPYIPVFWWKRSDVLLKLPYPELAAIDAY